MRQKFTVLFDLDGTLVDTAPDLMRAHNHVMKKFGYPTKSTEEIRNLVGKGAGAMIGRSIWGSARKELSKISTNTGVVLNKDVSDLESLKKEFERFRKLVTQQLESIGGGGGGGSEDVDLSEVDQDIIPDANNTRSLGTSAKRWKDLFLSGQTINLGGATISSDGTGTVSVSATGVELPAGSKSGDNKLAVVAVDSRGAEQAAQVVPFFTKSGGLTTANTNFSFNATIDEKFVFTGSKSFTLANGSSLTDSAITLFQF